MQRYSALRKYVSPSRFLSSVTKPMDQVSTESNSSTVIADAASLDSELALEQLEKQQEALSPTPSKRSIKRRRKKLRMQQEKEMLATTTPKIKIKTNNNNNGFSNVNAIFDHLEQIDCLKAALPSHNEILQVVKQAMSAQDSGGKQKPAAKGKKKDTLENPNPMAVLDRYRQIFRGQELELFLQDAFEAACEAQDFPKALEMLRDLTRDTAMHRIPLETFYHFLRQVQQAGLPTEFAGTLDLMERSGYVIHPKHYKSLLKLSSQGLWDNLSHLDTALEAFQNHRMAINRTLRRQKLHETSRSSADDDDDDDTNLTQETFVYWLGKAARYWRADVFIGLLTEMRLLNIEPHIPSLTSIEPGKCDPALTVIEGVRALGLDPHFAMSSIVTSIRQKIQVTMALEENHQDVVGHAQISRATRDQTLEAFGDLPRYAMTWPTTPVPQLLETQAAGLLLSEESFERIKHARVQNIDSYLKLLPIDANLAVNLRRQLQIMSLMTNTVKVRKNLRSITSEYNAGSNLKELSQKYNYPPVSIMRNLLMARGLSPKQVKAAIASPEDTLESKRDQNQIKSAKRHDSTHRKDPLIYSNIDSSVRSSSGMECLLADYLRAQGLRLKTQPELYAEQVNNPAVRRRLTPDILFEDPVMINGEPVRWIDAKNFYGSHLVSKRNLVRQLNAYTKEWGAGAVVYSMGFSDMIARSVPDVTFLDMTPIPKIGLAHARMRAKARVYDRLNRMLNWKAKMSTALSLDEELEEESLEEKKIVKEGHSEEEEFDLVQTEAESAVQPLRKE